MTTLHGPALPHPFQSPIHPAAARAAVAVLHLMDARPRPAPRGCVAVPCTPVHVHSCPHALDAPALHGTVTMGMVSAVLGDVVLVDASVLPGAMGGGVSAGSQPLAMLLAPCPALRLTPALCWSGLARALDALHGMTGADVSGDQDSVADDDVLARQCVPVTCGAQHASAVVLHRSRPSTTHPSTHTRQ